ncbi:MAG: hypothetical protein M3P38_02805 [Chloroflexota bacterium]|nr:hypothetical protein [Chloroflexota bacterium]MDP9361301.1 hypothetical protein [Acidobacteriota bacterium]
MPDPKVEDVFKTSGVPTHTFVEPGEFRNLRVALRSAGKGVVVEGPSGIGKSTGVSQALAAEKLGDALTLSARVPADVELIHLLSEIEEFGMAVIEDFHALDMALQREIADLMKVLADESSRTGKLVIIGIPRAGESLVKHAPDLANRIETIRFAVEPDKKIEELIALGERALNIELTARADVVRAAAGSFYLAQMLCFEVCVAEDVLERRDEIQVLRLPYDAVKKRVHSAQESRYGDIAREFARGTRFRPSGRAPYFHVLRWLADSRSSRFHCATRWPATRMSARA